MKNLPTLLAGPILRRCSYKSITIWLATSKKMKNLTATVKTYETKRAKSFPVKTIRKEIQVGKSLWIYLLNVQPNTPQKEFPTETVLAYNIGTKKRKDDLGIDKIEGFNIKEFAYAPYKLPTLILQNPESKNFNTLYGSCRKPHGPGHDAAHAANEKIKQEVSNKNKRPSALLLGGDQMYADDVAASMIRPIQTVATKLFGLEEPLPGVENPYEILVNGRLNVIHSKAKFTSGESHNHLMTFGEFCATYVLAWNDKVWDKKFLSAKALTEEMTAEEIPEDYDAFFANEKKKLEEYIKGAKAFKRVLANTPTYMIFDDHEITDDWNLNPLWTKRVRSSKLGKRIVANGLAAFWLFQALGNHPTYYGNKVNDLSKVIKGHVDNIHDPQSKEAKEFDKRTRAYYDKWSFVTETYPKVLFTNLRTRRSSTKMKYLDEQKNTGARLMTTGELSRIRKMLT